MSVVLCDRHRFGARLRRCSLLQSFGVPALICLRVPFTDSAGIGMVNLCKCLFVDRIALTDRR